MRNLIFLIILFISTQIPAQQFNKKNGKFYLEKDTTITKILDSLSFISDSLTTELALKAYKNPNKKIEVLHKILKQDSKEDFYLKSRKVDKKRYVVFQNDSIKLSNWEIKKSKKTINKEVIKIAIGFVLLIVLFPFFVEYKEKIQSPSFNGLFQCLIGGLILIIFSSGSFSFFLIGVSFWTRVIMFSIFYLFLSGIGFFLIRDARKNKTSFTRILYLWLYSELIFGFVFYERFHDLTPVLYFVIVSTILLFISTIITKKIFDKSQGGKQCQY